MKFILTLAVLLLVLGGVLALTGNETGALIGALAIPVSALGYIALLLKI